MLLKFVTTIIALLMILSIPKNGSVAAHVSSTPLSHYFYLPQNATISQIVQRIAQSNIMFSLGAKERIYSTKLS